MGRDIEILRREKGTWREIDDGGRLDVVADPIPIATEWGDPDRRSCGWF
jgi:hypothetical protein